MDEVRKIVKMLDKIDGKLEEIKARQDALGNMVAQTAEALDEANTEKREAAQKGIYRNVVSPSIESYWDHYAKGTYRDFENVQGEALERRAPHLPDEDESYGPHPDMEGR